MKKLLFIAAMASVALVSCVKNEVVPINEDDQEITFMTAPVTKTPGTFDDGNHFTSWAYYTGDTDWNYPTGATNWINGAEIQYMTDKWKNSTQSYYWPKDDGKLTFFAFSDNTNAPALTGATVSCASNTGVTISNFDITENVNVDLLVADPAKDQQANNTDPETYYGTVGVPTLFRHKLANVEFKIKYALADDSVTDFTLTSIKLQKLNTTGTFTQYATSIDDKVGKWELTADIANEILYTDQAADFTAGEVNLETNADQHYFMPQTFDGTQKIEVIYNAKGTGVGKNHTLTGDLKTIFASGWEIGKRYICTITISPDEILWDPAVESWVENSSFAATL